MAGENGASSPLIQTRYFSTRVSRTTAPERVTNDTSERESQMLTTRWNRTRSLRGLLLAGLLISVSGCWNAPDAQTSAMYGAAQGALMGSVIGCASAYNFSSAHHEATAFSIGCPVGLAAGALVGGIAGYAFYGPPPKQWEPPVKDKPATSSLNPNPANEQSLDAKADDPNALNGPQQPSVERRIEDLSQL